ncbi:MAG TPA: sensor histidine kinase [Opitutaceae bacterium]|jgi:signal transduction histidine kinase|nr:sensor histidine kinase [Opitutaceae bacterium]
MPPSSQHLGLGLTAAGVVFVGILGAIVLRFRNEERAFLQDKIIRQEADALYPEALQQMAESEAASTTEGEDPGELLAGVLKTAEQDDMRAVMTYGPDGSKIQAAPPSLLLPDLPPDDYPRLLGGEQISRYLPDLDLRQLFAGAQGRIPMLEVMLPLHGKDPAKILGFVEYLIDGHKLAGELADVDRQLDAEAAKTLGVGGGLIAAVLVAAFFGLRRQQRIIDERSARLTRANFELTLAAKASALGQITSHLIHGLQGPVAGLRAAMASLQTGADWRSAADYAERLQAMIQETVAMLGDAQAQVSYRLSGRDLLETIRRRNAATAADKGVHLAIAGGERVEVDSHRGGLVCLIAANLVQNAIAATAAGGKVEANLQHSADSLVLTVTDQGPGISPEVQARLFEPGATGRPGGTGLGLAISQLLARQIGASLVLAQTGPQGTTFRLTLAL